MTTITLIGNVGSYGEIVQTAHLIEEREDPSRFLLVDHADRESDVYQYKVTDDGFGHVREVDVLDDAAEVDAAATLERLLAGGSSEFFRESRDT